MVEFRQMVVLRMIGLVALGALVGGCSDGFVPPPSGGGGSGGTGAAGGTAGTAGTGATAGTGGGAGSGGTGGVSGTGGMGGGGGIGGIGGVGGSVGGACVNERDLEIIRMTLPNLRWQAAFCGTPCQGLAHDAFLVCVNQCVETQVPGLTSECTSCYDELAWCAGTASTTCNPWCANETLNACTPDCTTDSAQCPGYSACLTELDRCAGRDSLDCLDDT